MRPATVTWGGVSNNEQIAGSAAQWPFVAKYMDAYFMHGAYWRSTKDEAACKSLQTLGEILRKNGKPVHFETGFGEGPGYDPSKPSKRQPYTQAQTDIARFREFRDTYGINVTKVRVDWFPMPAMGIYAQYYKTREMRKLLAMVTGAKEFGPVEGFNRATAHWVDYGLQFKEAFPKMELVFDQALCNHGRLENPTVRQVVPWKGFGFGYVRQARPAEGGAPMLLDGKPIDLVFDFADQLNGVISSSREFGINFVGFEGDTPFNYYEAKLSPFPNDALVNYLITVERFLHGQNLKNGRIINDCGNAYGDADRGWIQVDLGETKEIDRVRLVWGAGFAKKGFVECSTDGSTWVSHKGFADPTGSATEVKLKPQQARFIKVEFRARGRSQGYQVAELEAYGPSQRDLNLALNKRATASSVSPAHPTAGQKGSTPELVDGDPSTYWESNCLPNDEWDKLYHDRTLAYLEFYQKAGGRADEYIAESWYDGPFTFFPETKPGTFTNLARDIIRRIKGLDDDGSLLKAELAFGLRDHDSFKPLLTPEAKPAKSITCTVKPGETRELQIRIRNSAKERNKGDARCTPLLRAEADGPFQISFGTLDGKDLTPQARCSDGYDGYLCSGLEPGEIRDLVVKVARSGNAPAMATGNIELKLYWNPQDPHAVIRDALMLNLK